MSEMAIQVKDLSKVYKLYNKPSDRLKETLGFHVDAREHYALKHVNFEIRKGETVGIIGTNGSGKSTILKIITGVLNPTGGEVNVDGRISALLELGAGFNMEYTGIENVYLNGTMLGFTKEEIDERLDNILEFADIGDFVNQPVKSYSSGMFVRLAFAVAINIDPEILIVDEALSVGDVFFQAKCYRKFEDFKKEGKTILFVSHDLGSITKYCDRAILLNQGEKIFEGTPKEAVDIYIPLIFRDLIVTSGNLICKFRDCPHVLFGFSRKSQHKVKFYLIPATVKRLSGSPNDVLYRKAFVDHITHSLRSGFRCKCQAALSDILYLSHHIQ